MFYQNELLVSYKRQEMEKLSREARMSASIKKESVQQKVTRLFTGSIEVPKSQSDNSSCVAC